jgi:tetratricopeptide (TPR) repeat protein
VRQVAKDLGVRYVLEGSMRKLGNKARITAQLINGTTGEHVWATSFDEQGDDIVALQDAVAAKVYASIAGFQGEIRHAEEQTAWKKSAMDLEEYDYYLRGHALFFQYTKEDMAKARAIWEEGLAKFPDSALLRVKIAWSLRQDMDFGWTDDPKRDLDRCWKLGIEAVAVENKSRLEQWYTHWLMAWLYQYHEADFERSVAEAKAAVQIVPIDAFARGDMAVFLANAGRTEEAIDWAQQALRRDPKGPEWYRNNLVWAYYLAGRYDDALTERKKVTSNECCRLIQAASLVRLGRLEEARAVMMDFLKENPGDTIEAQAVWPLKEPYKQAWLNDLRKAGLPEK